MSDERQARIDAIKARISSRVNPCTVNLTDARWLLSELEAAQERAEQAELDRRAIRAALQDYYSVAWRLTGKPTITADGSQDGWNDLRNLVEQPVVKLIARHRAALVEEIPNDRPDS